MLLCQELEFEIQDLEDSYPALCASRDLPHTNTDTHTDNGNDTDTHYGALGVNGTMGESMVVAGEAEAQIDGGDDGDGDGSKGLEVGSNGSHRENGEETDSLSLSLVVETDSSPDTDTAATAEILRKERQLLISRVKVRTHL